MLIAWGYQKYKAKKQAKEERKRAAAAAANPDADSSAAQNAETPALTEQPKEQGSS